MESNVFGLTGPLDFQYTGKMNQAESIALFTGIQLVSGVLFIVGLPICAVLAMAAHYTSSTNYNKTKWISKFPSWAWLWSNDEDGVTPPGYTSRWGTFVWTALRNPVNNLRFVSGVSGQGRPLYYRSWLVKGKQYYFKCGWMSNGFPCLSGGAGRGW